MDFLLSDKDFHNILKIFFFRLFRNSTEAYEIFFSFVKLDIYIDKFCSRVSFLIFLEKVYQGYQERVK